MQTSRPNILFILTDDQRFNALGAAGNAEIRTPNLDRLAERSTLFTHAHIMGGNCGAVCMPSRAMIMTGRSLWRLHASNAELLPLAERPWSAIPGHTIPAEYITVFEHLRTAGYITFHAGKWHQDQECHHRAFARGARLFGFKNGWYETCNGHWHMPVHDFNTDAQYDPNEGYFVGEPVQPFSGPYERIQDGGVHSSEAIADDVIAFLQNYREDAPFFAYMATVAPHDPRQAPRTYMEQYSPDQIPLPENYQQLHPFDNGELWVRDELLEAHPRRPERIREHIADYYGIISHLDAQIGRVLDTLAETGQDENTIIVFAGDNGLALGSHGLMGKQNLYDHSVRVPLMISGPGIPRGVHTNALVYLFDIYPTLCELAGVNIPSSVEGKSLLPAITRSGASLRDHLFCAYRQFQRSVRDERYKLIEYAVDGTHRMQLFDLLEDPSEMRDLANNPTHRSIRTRLHDELYRWRSEYGDTLEEGELFWKTVEKRPVCSDGE